ncbi:MAG: HEAT repeat domain-containing protein [Ignavibacteriae bacterium]|nr:HEAT repeat domain-containing protein [Ignavibacteriota bacterium]
MKHTTIHVLLTIGLSVSVFSAQQVTAPPMGVPPIDVTALQLERLSTLAPLPELSGLGAELAGLGGSLSALRSADLTRLETHAALATTLSSLHAPGFELFVNFPELPGFWLADGDSPQQDPGYQTYKDGYNLVLQEKWVDARKKLAEVASKFPKSRYVDDAHYWIAYSWMSEQPKKAAQLYREFFKKYPNSNYFDDAVADLGRLEGNAAADSVRTAKAEYEAQLLKERIRQMEPPAPVAAVTPPGVVVSPSPSATATPSPPRNHDDDPELRIKKDVIEALGRNPNESAFKTLSDIALDPKQPHELRESAMYALHRFDREKVLGLYVQLAQNDPDMKVREHAVYEIGRLARNNDANALKLLQQYVLDGKQPRKVRESAMHGLREVRGADALNILLQVAKNDADQNMRQSALYYIGQYARKNDEQALKVLRDYALDRTQQKEVRETALHSLKEIKNADALAVYLEIAKNDPDDKLRQTALYYIGQFARSNDEKAYQILKEYALDRKQDAELRETALHSLRELRRTDVLPILVDVAKNDPSEKIRSSAIYQIGQMRKYDSNVSKVLTELARDHNQPREIRKTAIYSLREFTDFDVHSFYIDLAKNDPDREIQQTAIYYLAQNKKDKSAAIDLLVKLFDELPADRTEAQETCIYGVANIGGEKAVDFLIKVAKTHKDYEMRQKAVYYLGNIGGEKARSALMEILQGK